MPQIQIDQYLYITCLVIEEPCLCTINVIVFVIYVSFPYFRFHYYLQMFSDKKIIEKIAIFISIKIKL